MLNIAFITGVVCLLVASYLSYGIAGIFWTVGIMFMGSELLLIFAMNNNKS